MQSNQPGDHIVIQIIQLMKLQYASNEEAFIIKWGGGIIFIHGNVLLNLFLLKHI